MECRPAFDFARDRHETVLVDTGAEFHTRGLHVGLAARTPLRIDGDGVIAEFALSPGDSASFVLHELATGESCGVHLSEDGAEAAFRDTVAFWRHWVSQCTYKGRWREIVNRSALALKLLTYEPTGAIVAAPTCSLPEGIGGERNWDYRYTWVRDSAFTVYAFLRLGFTEEAKRFFHFISENARRRSDASLQIMYGIDGRQELTEEILDHLEGYMGSRPVRVGNAAYNQVQLDIYGELLDAVYLFNKYGQPIGYDLWLRMCRIVDWVCDNWQQKDEGIWEVRGGAQHFVYSKLMCWVAVDRALRIADARSFPGNRDRWLKVRDEIYRAIMDKGWSAEASGVRPALRQRGARRRESDDGARAVRLADRSAHAEDAGRHAAAARAGRAGREQPGLPLQPRSDRRRADRPGGHLQHLHLLAGRGADPGGPVRAATGSRRRA